MSRRTIAWLLIFAAALFSAAPSIASARALPAVSRASIPAFPGGMNGVLKVGSRGPAVTAVQAGLLRRGYKIPNLVSGYFGVTTGAAVRLFKIQHRSPYWQDTPMVGPRTYAALTGWKPPASTPAPRTTPTPAPKPVAEPVVHCSAHGLTCKTTPTHGLYCPIIGAEFGDGWGAGRGHQGVDLLIGVGHKIHAVESGVIVKQGFQGNGALVITQKATSGAVYYYGHNSRNLVVTGQHVVAGQVIAISGETGTVGAPHLHFERRPGVPGDQWYHASPANPVPFTKAICL